MTVDGLATYRNGRAYPFCPGCGHGTILDRLDEALVELALDPARVVLVSDIGCSGLSDQYFATSAFHGLHGRSLTYATGLKLARPELEVIVLLGDGGTGIGGAHLLNAARRNVGLTVVVFNNFNYGMTGGQHSATTPAGARTSTTPGGNLEAPLDLCGTVAVNGAAYAWRGTSFDDDLAERMVEAVRTPGFALLDVWELCTSFFVPANHASRRTLATTLDGSASPAAWWRGARSPSTPPPTARPTPARSGARPPPRNLWCRAFRRRSTAASTWWRRVRPAAGCARRCACWRAPRCSPACGRRSATTIR